MNTQPSMKELLDFQTRYDVAILPDAYRPGQFIFTFPLHHLVAHAGSSHVHNMPTDLPAYDSAQTALLHAWESPTGQYLRNSETEPRYFFTFPFRLPALRNRYVVMPGDFENARARVMQHINTRFAFQYPIAELPEQESRFGLTEISLEDAAKHLFEAGELVRNFEQTDHGHTGQDTKESQDDPSN